MIRQADQPSDPQPRRTRRGATTALLFGAWAGMVVPMSAQGNPATKDHAASNGGTNQAAPIGRQPVTLHQAWLAEVMDLDGRRAIELYTELARDRQPENHERWLALARLLELHRLGQTSAPNLDPLEVPKALRGPFAAAASPADPALLEARARTLLEGGSVEPPPPPPGNAPGAPGSGPATPAATSPGAPTQPAAPAQPAASAQPQAAAESPRLPVLRPVVHDAETWLLGLSGLSWRDRLRQRQPQSFDRSQFTERYNAMRVMAAELDGRRSQADEVRALYFTQWRPPALDGPPQAVLDRVRQNLQAMQRERSQASPLLPRLQEALDKAAAEDPQGALQLVLRLPLFAELLLAPVPPIPPVAPEPSAATPQGAGDPPTERSRR